jgi:hypothetical protein
MARASRKTLRWRLLRLAGQVAAIGATILRDGKPVFGEGKGGVQIGSRDAESRAGCIRDVLVVGGKAWSCDPQHD